MIKQNKHSNLDKTKSIIFESINPNDPRTEGESYLINIFKESSRFDGWTIFEEPHINSMKPDFVLLHPTKGILIIEVKDWRLDLQIYENGGYIHGNDGNLHKKNPIDQVENYKNNILKSELINSVYLSENFGEQYYGCIEVIVYFHKASNDQAIEFCGENNGYTKIWTKNDINYIKNPQNKLSPELHTYALSLNHSKFSYSGMLQSMVEELNCHLQYSDYNYERRESHKLSGDQERLAKLSPGSVRRWGGVAGSGKSLTLCEKAVKALKKNNKVLILTFNITLVHYLRDLCSQQFGEGQYEGERKKLKQELTITYFHQFLIDIMKEHSIDVPKSKDDKEFTKKWIRCINEYLKNNSKKSQFNYDYILIDEGQDFEGEWIRFLKTFFTKKGEMFIVYDKAQDLFEHGIWIEDSEQIKDIGFRGSAGSLKYTHRLPSLIVEKIHEVRKATQIDEEKILTFPNSQIDLLQKITWINHETDNIEEKLSQISHLVDILRKNNTWEDITIITTNENTGVKIVEFYKNRRISTSHVYDMNCEKDKKSVKKRSGSFKVEQVD